MVEVVGASTRGGTRHLLAAAAVMIASCGPGHPSGSDSGGGSSDGAAATSAVTTSGAESSGTAVGPECGDGVPEPGHFCFELLRLAEIDQLAAYSRAALAVDLDGDGRDSVLAAAQGTLDIVQVDNAGKYALEEMPYFFGWGAGSDWQPTHLDGDDRIDVGTGSQTSNTVRLLTNGGGALEEPELVDLGSMGAAAFVDPDSDGKAEIFKGDSDNVARLWRLGPDGWEPQMETFEVHGCRNLLDTVVADFTGDGREDVAYVGASILHSDSSQCQADWEADPTSYQLITILRGVAGAEMLEPLGVVSASLPVVTEIVAGDFDADGAMDLAVAGFNPVEEMQPAIAMLRGIQGGGFDDAIELAVGGSDLAVGDLDGNGADELVAEGVGIIDDPLAVATVHELAVGQPYDIGDVNGDGVGDIVLRHTSTNSSVLAIQLSTP